MDELDAAVAHRLRAVLEVEGLRREDVAREMTKLGFRWTGNTVTQVVTGRRALSLLEVAGLCEALNRSVADLLGDQQIALPSGSVSAADVFAALTRGRSAWRAHHRGELTPDEQVLYEQFFPAEHDEALAKAARRLGVAVAKARDASIELWGHELGRERDRRVAPQDGESRRALQARRGHATRALIEELRDYFAGRESESR